MATRDIVALASLAPLALAAVGLFVWMLYEDAKDQWRKMR